MLTVRCPRCKHDQLYDPKIGQGSPTVVGRKKRCVYCGMTFSVHTDQTRTNIVAVGKILDPNKAF
jgi:uncharacterized protein (DUF983 family)